MNSKLKMNYYDKFLCTADACPISCCQQWRIGVDEETYATWQQHHLCDHVQSDEAGYAIKLDAHKKCPYLNEKQLCQLVLQHGDTILSETCANFPRRINTFETHQEFSLDTGCPAVVDLLADQKGGLIQEGVLTSKEKTLFFKVRERLLAFMSKEQYTLGERFKLGFYMLLDVLEAQVQGEALLAIYGDELQIQQLLQAIKKVNEQPVDTFWESNELFLDVTTNYRNQKLYEAYLEPIAEVAEQLQTTYTDKQMLEKVGVFEQQFSQYHGLMTQYVHAEIVGGCMLPEMTLEEMVIAYEWIALAYGILKQALFLKWHLEGERVLTYEMVRDYMCITSRVTGYGMDDIKEYMENSFERSIWDWGYLALIVGK